MFKIMKRVKARANPNHHPRLVFCKQDDGADLVGDRRVGVPRSENRDARVLPAAYFAVRQRPLLTP